MIRGIGVDIVETRRVADGLSRHGERFAQRILAETEWDDFREAADRAVFLAKRFAAKEAFGKAVGTGIRAPVTLRSFWVVRDALGKPSFAFAPDLAGWLEARGIARHHLSITDEREYAAAFVVVEGSEEAP